MNYARNNRRTLRVFALLVILPIIQFGQAWAQEWTWTVDKVARGSTSSIALDAGQNLHLTYLTRDAKVFYGLRPAGASKWFSIMLVDSTHTTANVYPQVAVDRKGRPHLCVSFGSLLYITLADHEWVKQQIDPGSGTISYYCSIAVAPDGTTSCGMVSRVSAWRSPV